MVCGVFNFSLSFNMVQALFFLSAVLAFIAPSQAVSVRRASECLQLSLAELTLMNSDSDECVYTVGCCFWGFGH